MRVLALIGTEKGGFVLRSDASRRKWTIDEPIFKGWKVTAAARDDRGRTLVGIASNVYGAAIHVSDDGKSWRQVAEGPAYTQESGRKLNQIWTLVQAGSTLYAGVDQAGIFQSNDRGESWRPMPGLNDHSTRSAWQPGFGGLCAHTILADPKNPKRSWCGISAVGVFRSDDGGATWSPKNSGVPAILEDKDWKDIGCCVHALASDPTDAMTIYRQDHLGMFRTRNGGDSWERIENGLPSRFGFPLAIDRRTRALFAVPLESDERRLPVEGKLRVYRSRNGGDSWEPLSRGLPQKDSYGTVLRSALATDSLEPCGIVFGTTAGTVHASDDGGESWQTLPCTLPRVLSVTTFVEA